jgi:endonuclease/exonuclease/phosphatase (EEP) superfamily protein YafD
MSATEGTGRHRLRRAVAAGVWLYLAAVLGLWLLVRYAGDRWWPATLLLFGPRWVCIVPIVVLVPLVAVAQRKLLWVLVAATTVVVFPVLGFRVPWARAFAPAGLPVRVLTYNVFESTVPPEALSALISELRPDIVALQECHQGAYADVFQDWHVCKDGELLVAARFPIRVRRATSSLHPPHTWPRATLLECTVTSPFGEFTVCNVHLPSPRYGLSEVVDKRTLISPSRRGQLERETANRDAVSASAAETIADHESDQIVAGDFNMPTDSTLYRRDWTRYTNAFSATGWGFGYSFRASLRGFGLGIRIDHVLMGGDWRPARCWLGPDLGSDHLPVIADLIWCGPDPRAN